MTPDRTFFWAWATRLSRRAADAALAFDNGSEDTLPSNDFLRSTRWRETYDEDFAELVSLGADPVAALSRAGWGSGHAKPVAGAVGEALPDAACALLVWNDETDDEALHPDGSARLPADVPPGCPWRFVGVFARDGSPFIG